jgi:GDP-4-dehydro-6-deoxy-D-mannose reductase
MSPIQNRIELRGKRILVTGARGFVGRHVVDRLTPEASVHPLVRRIAEVGSESEVEGELTSLASMQAALRTVRPDAVIHLAGATPPADVETFYAVNALGTVNLLEAARLLDRPMRIVVVGSAAELGPVEESALPVGEEYRARPTEPYGTSKLLATTAALSARPPLEVCVARVFNPIGPGLPESQALGRFAAVLASSPTDHVELTVGDLTPRRDFIDVRDVAEAIIALMVGGVPGRLYHVGTGRSRAIAEGLRGLAALSRSNVVTRFDPALARRTGPSDSRADISRIRSEVGWSPVIPWEQSLLDLWNDSVLRLTAPAPLL